MKTLQYYLVAGMVMCLPLIGINAAPGDLDPGFNAHFLTEYVGVVAMQNDAKILIGGNFTQVQGMRVRGIARLHADGRIDTSFLNNLAGPDSDVYLLAVQPDGKILIAGNFTSVNGVLRSKIARLNSDGSLDTTFFNGMSGPDGALRCLALQPDGKVYVGGDFYSINGVIRTNLARLNSDGSVDASFGHVPPASSLVRRSGYHSYLSCLALQSDGGICAWRSVITYSGDGHGNDFQLASFNPDASLRVEFPYFARSGWNLDPSVSSVAIQKDGKVLVGGVFDEIGGTPRRNLARLNLAGGVDRGFAPFIGGSVTAIAALDDDKIIIAVLNLSSGRSDILRLDVNGLVDAAFVASTAGGFPIVRALTVQPDNRLLICGGFTSVNGAPCAGVARLMITDAAPGIQGVSPDRTCEEGASVKFLVHPTGYPPPTCQWLFNRTNLLVGCTNEFLRLDELRLAHAGEYSVVVTNIVGSATSAPVALGVIPAVERRSVPAITFTAEVGSILTLVSTTNLEVATNWNSLATFQWTGPADIYLDLTSSPAGQRFYRTSQAAGAPPTLDLHTIPALTLTGNPG